MVGAAVGAGVVAGPGLVVVVEEALEPVTSFPSEEKIGSALEARGASFGEEAATTGWLAATGIL